MADFGDDVGQMLFNQNGMSKLWSFYKWIGAKAKEIQDVASQEELARGAVYEFPCEDKVTFDAIKEYLDSKGIKNGASELKNEATGEMQKVITVQKADVLAVLDSFEKDIAEIIARTKAEPAVEQDKQAEVDKDAAVADAAASDEAVGPNGSPVVDGDKVKIGDKGPDFAEKKAEAIKSSAARAGEAPKKTVDKVRESVPTR